jgi:DnaK suppressor protein
MLDKGMTEEMTPEACRIRYRDRLVAERADRMSDADNTNADRKPVMLDQQSVGRLSRMDALQGQAMAKAMQGRREGRIRAIDAALERLSGEDFGWCEDCGEFIGVKRLDLDPTLLLCVSCAR